MKKLLLSSLICLFACLPSLAADTGWVLFQTAENVDGPSPWSWTFPANALSVNADYSTCAIDDAEISDYLTLTDPDCTIPSGATIDGIELRIHRGTSGTDIKDWDLRLVKGGTRVGNNLASSAEWPGAPVSVDYGGATNLWGTTWTDTDINSTFGMALQVEDQDTSADNARVVTVWVKIHYTEAAPPSGFVKSRGFFFGF